MSIMYLFMVKIVYKLSGLTTSEGLDFFYMKDYNYT